jgi:hypothetical protein
MFACICPKFREARTSAHNQVRQAITSFLFRTLKIGRKWKTPVFEETCMKNTRLALRSLPAISIVPHARQIFDCADRRMSNSCMAEVLQQMTNRIVSVMLKQLTMNFG